MNIIMNYNKEKTVIDLSGALDISDLAIKISSILESNNAADKEIYLDLGNLELKQSQLMSIKALIETMDSKLIGVKTLSELTLASAESLNLSVNDFSSPAERDCSSDDNIVKPENTEQLSSFEQLKKVNSLGDFVSDTPFLTEVNTDDTNNEENQISELADVSADVKNEDLPEEKSKPEEIHSALDAAFGVESSGSDLFRDEKFTMFEQPLNTDEDIEITEVVENNNDQYVLLDTEGITPDGLELIKANTSDSPTLYLTQTLRSGQTISYEGNIFIIGDAHPGSEVIATGDITIWGILGGMVHAGSKGNTEAKIRALKLNPIQLRIANVYSRRNDTVNVPYVQKSNEFTPEEARIDGKRIVIYKTLRRED